MAQCSLAGMANLNKIKCPCFPQELNFSNSRYIAFNKPAISRIGVAVHVSTGRKKISFSKLHRARLQASQKQCSAIYLYQSNIVIGAMSVAKSHCNLKRKKSMAHIKNVLAMLFCLCCILCLLCAGLDLAQCKGRVYKSSKQQAVC